MILCLKQVIEDLNLLCSILLTTIGKILIFRIFRVYIANEILNPFMVTAYPHFSPQMFCLQ